MPIVSLVPRGMLEKKPAHGAPCTRCGLCCYASLCDLAVAIHGRREGPCPELKFDADGSRCGVVDRSEGTAREDAALLINAGAGCDMKLHQEPRNHQYVAQRDLSDYKNRDRLNAARKRWGLIR